MGGHRPHCHRPLTASADLPRSTTRGLLSTRRSRTVGRVISGRDSWTALEVLAFNAAGVDGLGS